MGRRNRRQRQKGLWVAAADLPHTAAHPFYRRLNELLDEHGFDEFSEQRCAKFYAPRMGRPSLTPGSYFRCLLVGYFEGIDGERGIAWRQVVVIVDPSEAVNPFHSIVTEPLAVLPSALNRVS